MKLDWRRAGSAYRALQSVGGEQRHQRGAWQPLLATGLARHFWAHRPAPPLKKRIGLLPIVFTEGDIGIGHLGVIPAFYNNHPSLKPKSHPTVSRPNIALPDMRDTTEVVSVPQVRSGELGPWHLSSPEESNSNNARLGSGHKTVTHTYVYKNANQLTAGCD